MDKKNTLHNQKQIGIIGNRISHTLSPAMHTAAFHHLHLDYVYGVIDVQEEWLRGLFSALRKQNFRGANVTVPHKKAVIPFLDSLSDEAKTIGAVNTIVNDNGVLKGYNTDAYGIMKSLERYKNDLSGCSAVILGAGGAARSAIFALGKYFLPAKIAIINRTLENAERLAEEFSTIFPSVSFSFFSYQNAGTAAIDEALLIINTTTVGMKPDINRQPLPAECVIKSTHIVFDIVYTPIETLLLTLSSKAGARTVRGVEMLLGQGEKAFELFTHQKFPEIEAREVLLRELR